MPEKGSSTRNPASPSAWKNAKRKRKRHDRPQRAATRSGPVSSSPAAWRAPRCSASSNSRRMLRGSSRSATLSPNSTNGSPSSRSSRTASAVRAGDLRPSRREAFGPPATMITLDYHEQTKHHFNRFARSLGYLDWATQPDPFRRYAGASLVDLSRRRGQADVRYEALFDGSAAPAPISDESVGEFLRCSMGLSAWKQFGQSRWALRVNPSSGNLHPTETYVIRDGRVWHYAVREHALEERCTFEAPADHQPSNHQPGFLVALTS